MDKTAKGNRVQLELIKHFESRGFEVDKCSKTGRFVNGSRDLFGLFDLVAIKGVHLLFIQVTCNQPHTHKKYTNWSKKHPIPITVVQFVKYDNKDWKIFIYGEDNPEVIKGVLKELI